jgi:hypothetical protein
MPVITTSPQALSIACPHCKCNVWLHAMLAGFAPPRAHHGIPEEAEASDSAEDSDIGPDFDGAAAMGSGMADRAGACAKDAMASPAATVPPAATAAMCPPVATAATADSPLAPPAATAATGPPHATAASADSPLAPPAATAATAITILTMPDAAAESIMTMALAEIADDTLDSTSAEETVEAATARVEDTLDSTSAEETVEAAAARVEAATAGVLAATADAEAMVPPAGAPGDLQSLRPCLLSHAPPEFVAEFRAMSQDPRFASACNDDCDVEDQDFDWFCDVADMLMRGGDAGWIGRAS